MAFGNNMDTAVPGELREDFLLQYGTGFDVNGEHGVIHYFLADEHGEAQGVLCGGEVSVIGVDPEGLGRNVTCEACIRVAEAAAEAAVKAELRDWWGHDRGGAQHFAAPKVSPRVKARVPIQPMLPEEYLPKSRHVSGL